MNQTRREFLRMAGKITLGAAAVSAVPAVVKADAAIEAPAWPWKYQPIDKAAVQARAYANFSTHGGCCAAVASGILEVFAETYGYPYNQINGRMFANGGGGYGLRSLCGALGGALAVLGCFLEAGDSGKKRGELYAWYKETAFPIYTPAGAEEHKWHSVSGSEMCADSVGNWMALSGLEFGSKERANRCACLSADVAGKVIDLLDAHFFGAAEAEAAPAPELAANEYIGTAKSEIGGEMKVKVTMDGDKIAKIEVLSHGETPDFWAKADPAVADAIIAAQSADVDTVSGATKSSEAIMAAVKDALSQIKK